MRSVDLSEDANETENEAAETSGISLKISRRASGFVCAAYLSEDANETENAATETSAVSLRIRCCVSGFMRDSHLSDDSKEFQRRRSMFHARHLFFG